MSDDTDRAEFEGYMKGKIEGMDGKMDLMLKKDEDTSNRLDCVEKDVTNLKVETSNLRGKLYIIGAVLTVITPVFLKWGLDLIT